MLSCDWCIRGKLAGLRISQLDGRVLREVTDAASPLFAQLWYCSRYKRDICKTVGWISPVANKVNYYPLCYDFSQI